MPRYKKFAPKNHKKEAVVFSLADQEFTCVPTMPAGVLIALSNVKSPKEGEEGGENLLVQVQDFIESVMVDADVPRFREVISSKQYTITFDELVDVMNWLIEEYSDRPTQPPSSSEDGQGQTGNGQTDYSPLNPPTTTSTG